ncbi:hypothetical protein NKH48_17605 [Mesorhizobium sp. M1233]|uniref:hypothetical protein n=1 Tax=Mesorhizobium sp. M1233 TaxID=2957072 RepID=UPI00333C34CE
MYTNRGLSEQEKNLIGNLQDKIKAKLDVAKTLGAFFTGLLAALIAFVGDSTKLDDVLDGGPCHFCLFITMPVHGCVYKYAFLLAILSTTVSVILFFSTMYAYDRLLMPREFWDEEHSAQALYVSMSEAWNKLFNAAIACLAIGLTSFVFALLRMGFIEIIVFAVFVGGALVYSKCKVPPKKFRADWLNE